MLTLTFDTGCINLRRKCPALTELERLDRDGTIRIHKTDVMDTEFMYGGLEEGDPPRGAGGLARRRLEKSAAYLEDAGVLVLGFSRVGHAAVGYAPEAADQQLPVYAMSDDARLRALTAVLCPNQRWEKLAPGDRYDVMQLATHARYCRDIFVTRNVNDFIHTGRRKQDHAKQRILRERYGVVVMLPDAALEEVYRRLEGPTPRRKAARMSSV